MYDDIEQIKDHNPDHAERCFDTIDDWERKIGWGRVPQNHLTYLTGSKSHNFYREWVGQSGYRIIYDISGDVMTVVAVRPKGDDTYDLDEFRRRMDQL
ncbi:type II toxin-antitoxin system RelE family toxin [Halosimplex pelagicum]|uniref:type II toxin-antitoxin system RelE family toxin n=1 Tax=Halosimplex pelagicum TaxID=869886 RepID=UPI001C54C9E2|nr:hypothetical protein [Halosimplex pelagicum]